MRVVLCMCIYIHTHTLLVIYTIFFSYLQTLQLPYHSAETRGKLAEELKRADAVVLTYACDKPSTLDRLSTFWLPELRQLEVCTKLVYYSKVGMLHRLEHFLGVA